MTAPVSQEPLFSCSDENCRVECSYPADMLAVFEGKPICEECYENNPPFDPVPWSALPPFVSTFEQTIRAQCEAEKAAALDRAAAIVEVSSPHLPTSIIAAAIRNLIEQEPSHED